MIFDEKNPLGADILHTARTFKNAIKEECINQGINYTYSQIIMILSFHTDGLTQNEIVEHTRLKAPTISLTLKNMENDGYIKRMTSLDDSRVIIVTLTEKGFELDKNIKKCFKKVEEKMIESLSDNDVKKLKEILEKLRDNLRKEK